MMTKKVQITFPPAGIEPVFGVRKTVMGLSVVEVHSGFYFSQDLSVSASRLGKEWIVERQRDGTVLDPLPSKRSALVAMIDLSGANKTEGSRMKLTPSQLEALDIIKGYGGNYRSTYAEIKKSSVLALKKAGLVDLFESQQKYMISKGFGKSKDGYRVKKWWTAKLTPKGEMFDVNANRSGGSRALASAEIRHSGFSYRAVMKHHGSGTGTIYYRFDNGWERIPWDAMPRAAYNKLREALKADEMKGPIT